MPSSPRSSAFVIYNAVTPNRWYRLRVAPKAFTHIVRMYAMIGQGFEQHVPQTERLASARITGRSRSLRQRLTDLVPTRRRRHQPPTPFAKIPRRELAFVVWRLLRSQWPQHSPEHETTPGFVGEWINAYDDGRDVADWYQGR